MTSIFEKQTEIPGTLASRPLFVPPGVPGHPAGAPRNFLTLCASFFLQNFWFQDVAFLDIFTLSEGPNNTWEIQKGLSPQTPFGNRHALPPPRTSPVLLSTASSSSSSSSSLTSPPTRKQKKNNDIFRNIHQALTLSFVSLISVSLTFLRNSLRSFVCSPVVSQRALRSLLPRCNC